MPEILAIDFASQRVCGIQADAGKDSVRIRSSFAFDLPADQEDPQTLGDWLKSELRSVGADARQLVVTLPREDVIVRHLELPDVSDDELPDIVRFQAASQSTIPMDQLALDFLPLPDREDSLSREVLVASVQKDRTARLRTIADSAGLDLTSIGVSSFATAELVRLAEDHLMNADGDVSLIVARHGNRVELSLFGRGSLYFTHSTQIMPEESEQSHNAILAEVSRSLISLHKQISNAKVVRAWIIGAAGEEAGLAEAIKGRFRCDVKWLDPFKAVGVQHSGRPVEGSHAEFAGPIGFLVAQAKESESSLDFLNPRRPAVKRDYTMWKRVGIAAAAVLTVIGLFAFRAIRVSQIQADTETKQKELDRQKDMLKRMEPQVDATDKVEQWASRKVNWLEEANQLADTMQGTERQYLTRLQFTNGTQDQSGLVNADGHAIDRIDVDALKAQVLSRPDIEVQPRAVDRTGRDGEYPFQFELSYSINRKKDAGAKE